VAVNAEQAEAWNGASGRHFIEQRGRVERMTGRLTARLLAAAQPRQHSACVNCLARMLPSPSPAPAGWAPC
jgi:hypothetical protein